MKYVVKVFQSGRWDIMWTGHDLERAKIMAHKPYITRNASSVRIIEITEVVRYDYKFIKRKNIR